MKFGLKEPPELVPYKLNIYQTGDFFAQHVDSPVVPDRMIGTLVVKLPVSTFEGGALVVQDNWKTIELLARTPAIGHQVEWAAIYGDCPHEVQPVTSGARVTLTFLILLSEKEPESTKPISSKKMDKDVLLVADALVNFQRQIKLDKFGLIMCHEYTSSMVTKGILKGKDALLYQGIRRAFPNGKIHLFPDFDLPHGHTG
jgi:hypothetical protein